VSILIHIPNGFSIAQTGLSGAGQLLQEAGQSGGLAWWLIILIAIIVLAVIFIPEMGRKDEGIRVVEYHPDEHEAEASDSSSHAETPKPEAEVVEAEPPPTPDNLTRIEGIGPRVATLLNETGILTFGQLAQADVNRLQELLQAQSLAMIDPSTWPEQATLAAEGNWEALDKLQDVLQGGRRA
jgi:predicted flap endonuclease-1-like 5' DNA nuclease